jgi:hypothetical protein
MFYSIGGKEYDELHAALTRELRECEEAERWNAADEVRWQIQRLERTGFHALDECDEHPLQ